VQVATGVNQPRLHPSRNAQSKGKINPVLYKHYTSNRPLGLLIRNQKWAKLKKPVAEVIPWPFVLQCAYDN
jgi:hypothetical protein